MKTFGNAMVRLMAVECACACVAYAVTRNYKLALYWLAATVINVVVSTF